MSVRIGHASISEKGTINGAKGDSTGKEVCIRTWYSKPWDYVAVHPSATVRDKHAQAVEDACNNNHIGYGQNDRNTAYTQYKSAGSIKGIKTNCNTDCSALQNLAALVSGASGVTYGSNGWTTSSMKAALKAAGYKIITDSTILGSADYCVRGAIYVKEGSHTVCGIDDGSKAEKTLEKAGLTSSATSTASSGTSSVAHGTATESAKSKDGNYSKTYTTTAELNLRAGAGTGKTILLTIPKGKKVTCYGYYTKVGSTVWLYVAYGKYTGFCSLDYLK